MEKRVTLTIALCVIVYLIWMAYFAPKDKPAPKHPEAERTGTENAGVDEKESPPKPSLAPAAGEPGEEKPAVPEAADPKKEPARLLTPALPEKTFTVDTEVFRCVLTNRGASVLSLRLKKHFTRAALKPAEKEDPANWLELFQEFQPGHRSLAVRLKKGNVHLDSGTWTCRQPPVLREGAIHTEFEFVLPDGVKVVKALRFPLETYAIDMILRFESPTEETRKEVHQVEIVGPAGVLKETEAGQFFAAVAAIDPGEDTTPIARTVSNHSGAKGWERQSCPGQPRYLAVVDKYFFSLITLPPSHGGVVKLLGAFTGTVTDEAHLEEAVRKTRTHPDKLREGFQLLEVGALYEVRFAEDAPTTELGFTVYAGPFRDHELEAAGLGAFDAVLKATGYSMCSIDWLILPVSAACRFFLNLFYHVVHNYGVAILMLTLMVRLFMFPLTRKQMVTMHKYQQQMARIKPDMDRLNEKFKTNPKRKQQELMKLYKEHNMNMFTPMVGCLPLVVTMPVFFGLFHALRSSMELRHAPFVSWIKDLSAPDALVTFAHPVSVLPMGCLTIDAVNVLPIIMGITWFAQMYFAPRPTDPQAAQTQKMMMIMPIMFTFMLYNYAAGLSLYWTFNSLLGLFEQRLIKRGKMFRTDPTPLVSTRPTRA